MADIDSVVSLLSSMQQSYLSTMIDLAEANIAQLNRRQNHVNDFLFTRFTRILKLTYNNQLKYDDSKIVTNFEAFDSMVSSYYGKSEDFDKLMDYIRYVISPTITNLTIHNREYRKIDKATGNISLLLSDLSTLKDDLESLKSKLSA